MDKIRILNKVSDIKEVNRKAQELNLNEVLPSSRTNKKYMVYDGYKMVHFGDINYEDFTKHNDTNRQINFKIRNRRFINKPVYSPSFLSYFLLW